MKNQNNLNWDRTYISGLVKKTDKIRIEVRGNGGLLFKDEQPIESFLSFGLRKFGGGNTGKALKYIETVAFWQDEYENSVKKTSTWFNNESSSNINLPNED